MREALLRRRSALRPEVLPDLLVAAVAAAVVSWRITVPSPWRDEGATWLAAGRPLADLLALVRTVDLVHLPYYLVAHVVLAADDTIVALRWLSAAAVAVAAGLLVSLGRRLGSTALGVTAGLLVAVSPLASRYGQEARPYALALLAATAAARALVAAVLTGGRWRWAGYAAAVVGVGLANVLALLVIAGQLPFVIRLGRRVLVPWALAAAAAGIVLAPFVAGTSRQTEQVSWLRRPTGDVLVTVLRADYGVLAVPVALLVLAAAVAWYRGGPALDAFVLGAGWGLLPPLLLWALSQAHPLFDGRYVVASLPGAALALSSLTPSREHALGRDRARQVGLVAALVAVLAFLGRPAQLAARDASSGHTEDARGAAALLAAHGRPGDAVLFLPWHYRILALMYPDRTSFLADVARGPGPIASATLQGVDGPASALPAALAGHDRVLVVTGPGGPVATTPADLEKVALLRRDYAVTQSWQVPKVTVTLYVRR